ncbi:UDP-N-acetylglucosamine transferase subunit ALG14 [Vibrio sp.]|nr:UDP-N-acetylglucosamine transferase subunit ALG14 [Vibrio sp.]
MSKILLVASPGGHFVQLSLIAEKMSEHQRIVVGTYDKAPSFMHCEHYHRITDFSRTDAYKALFVSLKAIKILVSEKPELVITTGAAPGLIFAFLAKLLGKKSVWVDSIANSKQLSLSGKIARKLGIKVLSQWKNVAHDNGLQYQGRVI